MKAMTEQAARGKLPPLPGLIAGSLVILGVLLSMFAAKGWLVLAGLGAFGPGILRELGLLRDQDEFQRRAAHRAGYHAYLIGGLVAAFSLSALHWSGADPGSSAEWLTLILVVLWMSWLFSALLAYWGAQKTASRVLMIFGSFWAVFVIASLIGETDMSAGPGELMLGVLMAFVFVAPFFVLAYTAGRWPRATGGVLLGVAAFFLLLTAPTWAARSLAWSSILSTATLLLVPLVASGIALLREGPRADEGEAPPEPVH